MSKIERISHALMALRPRPSSLIIQTSNIHRRDRHHTHLSNKLKNHVDASHDQRFERLMIPSADGMAMARKTPSLRRSPGGPAEESTSSFPSVMTDFRLQAMRRSLSLEKGVETKIESIDLRPEPPIETLNAASTHVRTMRRDGLHRCTLAETKRASIDAIGHD